MNNVQIYFIDLTIDLTEADDDSMGNTSAKAASQPRVKDRAKKTSSSIDNITGKNNII